MAVLLSHLVVLGLLVQVLISQLLQLCVQFLLLLLHPLVVHLIEVPLLQQLVVGAPCFLSHDNCPVQLIPLFTGLLPQLLALDVLFRDFAHAFQASSLLLQLVPLLLEVLQGLVHLVPNEEIP